MISRRNSDKLTFVLSDHTKQNSNEFLSGYMHWARWESICESKKN